MVEPIPNLPDSVLGFVATGTVTAHDYESVIMPAVEARFSRHKKVRFLYHLGEAFSGFDAAAMWDDMKIGLKHPMGWERMAVVADVEWVRAAVMIFALGIPGHVRVFRNHDLAEAIRWVSE
jgi:SpoIIAA-like